MFQKKCHFHLLSRSGGHHISLKHWSLLLTAQPKVSLSSRFNISIYFHITKLQSQSRYYNYHVIYNTSIRETTQRYKHFYTCRPIYQMSNKHMCTWCTRTTYAQAYIVQLQYGNCNREVPVNAGLHANHAI